MDNKKIQRRVNNIIRTYNQTMHKDDMLKRFQINQVKRVIKPYKDNSGLNCSFLFKITDNITKEFRITQWYSDYSLVTFPGKFWDEVNNFICKILDKEKRC